MAALLRLLGRVLHPTSQPRELGERGGGDWLGGIQITVNQFTGREAKLGVSGFGRVPSVSVCLPKSLDYEPSYNGFGPVRLNFMEHFWTVKGSRIYPPVPHITLNISQDLAANCAEFLQGGTGYELVRLLTDDARHIGERLFTALSWYNGDQSS